LGNRRVRRCESLRIFLLFTAGINSENLVLLVLVETQITVILNGAVFLRPSSLTKSIPAAELVHVTERAIVLRAISGSASQEERSEMAIAKASLLSIKTHKLGWPSVHSG
jgi:hypothetical protein